MERREKYCTYLGTQIEVKVDRPIGSRHPEYDFLYEVNYGFVENTIAGDGREIDAYVLGTTEAIAHYRGLCVAVIFRRNDVEHKLVVSNKPLSVSEVQRQTNFVEQYFDIEVEVCCASSDLI